LVIFHFYDGIFSIAKKMYFTPDGRLYQKGVKKEIDLFSNAQ